MVEVVNLGTAQSITLTVAKEIASGLKMFLGQNADAQILWKLKMEGGIDACVTELLAKEASSRRLRIVAWLMAEPSVIVQSGHIVCSVDHGGANSFNDSPIAGVPKSSYNVGFTRTTSPHAPRYLE